MLIDNASNTSTMKKIIYISQFLYARLILSEYTTLEEGIEMFMIITITKA